MIYSQSIMVIDNRAAPFLPNLEVSDERIP